MQINKKKVQKNFSAAALAYDRVSCLQRQIRRVLLSHLSISPGAIRILDIGTGTGRLLLDLGRFPPTGQQGAGHLHGCDLAYGMLDQARRIASEAFLVLPLFIQADAEQLPYRAAIFDLLLSNLAYQWVADLDSAFKEAYRVLKPGGDFCFSTFGRGTLAELHLSFRQAHRKLGSVRSHGQPFSTSKDLKAALHNSGFKDIALKEWSILREYPDLQSLLLELKTTGASNATLTRSAGLGGRKVIEEMRHYYQQHFQHRKGILATYRVIVGQGKK